MDPAGIEALRDAIKHMHGCDSEWFVSVPVIETFNGATVWEGEVQVFNLVGRPKAKRAFAWSHATEGERRKFYAVLEAGPIKSPADAVRASIAAG